MLEINHIGDECEENFFNTIKNFSLVINKILELLINSNKKIDDIIIDINNIIDKIPYKINNKQLDNIRNIKNYINSSELLLTLDDIIKSN